MGAKFKPDTSRNNTISYQSDDGELNLSVKAGNNGEVLLNGKEIETMPELQLALNLVIRSICAPYNIKE